MAGKGGWMTARKSNAQIARDKKRAEENRRRRRGLASKTKRKRDESDEEQDDDDSLADFVVEDEEEEADWSEKDEEEEEEDEMEEELLEDDDISESSPPVAKKPTKKAKLKKKSALEALESSDDDSDDFLSSMAKPSQRKSKPAPHMLNGRKQSSFAKRSNDFTDVLTSPEDERKPSAAMRPKHKRPPVTKDRDEVVKPPAIKAKFAKKKCITLSSDEEDDDELLRDPFAKSSKRSAATKGNPKTLSQSTVSKFFQSKSAPLSKDGQEGNAGAAQVTHPKVDENPRVSDDTDIMDEDEAMAMALAISESMNQTGGTSNPMDEEPTPLVGRRTKSGKSRVFADDDDDFSPAKQLEPTVDIADSDEDIETNASKKKNRFSKFAANQKSVLEVLEDSDDDKEPDDEDDNYGEEELDEDAQEARSILQTAQRLSAQILQTLTSWGGSGGMIVQNGAITFTGNASETKADSSSSSWIPNETMKQACPDVKLAPYQLIGVNWLALLHKLTVEVNGNMTSVNGVLADEMGLGKTCQTISFLAWLKYQESAGKVSSTRGAGEDDSIAIHSDDESVDLTQKKAAPTPHLIVVPASVLSNWAIEFEKFAPHLKVVKYHGSMAEREEIKEYLRQFLSGRARRNGESLDVILAPLTYFQKERSDDRSFLRKFRYNYLIADEAHLLKNHQGQRYKTLDRFRTNHRLLLSGTPVMNNPQELMSLLCFLMPLFSRKSQGFAHDEEGNDGGSRMLQHFVSLDSQGQNDVEAYRKLKELFAPFVLRRRKQDVLSQIMPPKARKVELVELDPVGRQIYNGVLEKHVKNKKRAAREHLFTQLRKAAHHPLLLRTRYLEDAEMNHLVDSFYKYGAFRGEGCTRERVKEELEKFNDFDIHLTALELLDHNPRREHDLRRYVLQQEDLFCSAKCQRLRTLLPDLVGRGHRVLIFSVWTSCLDLLSCLLEQLDMQYLRMEGSTAVSERQSLIDQFNRDETIPIFLLSTKACGLGINLTAADTCIMHDIDFNPFNDLQAEDRCHRIGQKKPVTVYKLVAKDTVDEDIFSMQERKAKMSAAIMESSSSDFDSKKERDNVLQSAVDRFLGSPAPKSMEKENELNIRDRASL